MASSGFRALYEEHLRKRPQQSRSRSVVEAILVAALDKLAQGQDEESLTVQDVAVRAGVGIGSLYDYFRDRKSLLAATAAKLTEDNLRAFEALLERVKDDPLDQAVGALTDFTLELYTKDKRSPRAVLRIAHALGLMPMLAESQTMFARSMADALRKRSDIGAIDPDVAAWNITQSVMGLVHTLVWQDEPTHSLQAVRDEAVKMYVRYLRGG